MKAIFLILVMIFTLGAAQIDEFATGVGYERDYNVALSKAKEQKKLLMLLVVADYCPWCKKFERKVLEDEEIKKIILRDFIPVVIDKAKDSGAYPSEYNAPLIPALFFIDALSGKKIYEVIAYKSKSEFLLELENLKKGRK